MTKSTGKPRGRPRKVNGVNKTVRKRGRPRLELLSDPDRYAIAAMPVFADHLHLNQRDASLLAVRFFSSPGRPETIRLKARKAWLEVPGPFETIEDLRAQFLQPNSVPYNGWERRKLWKRVDWLQNMAGVVELVFFPGEISDKKQIVDRALNLAAMMHERRFVKKNIIPHFGNPEILLSYLY